MAGNTRDVVLGKKAWKDCIVPMWRGCWGGRAGSGSVAKGPGRKGAGSFPLSLIHI